MFGKLVLAGILLVSGAIAAQAAPVLRMTPSSSSVTLGDSFTIDIRIEGVTDLYAWEADVNFGPTSLVNATGQASGSFFVGVDLFVPGTVDNTLGTITFIAATLFGLSGVSGDGILAELTFSSLALGTADFSFDRISLVDSLGLPIFVGGDRFGTSVEIVPRGAVPEPAPLALLGLAVLAYAAPRVRRAMQRS